MRAHSFPFSTVRHLLKAIKIGQCYGQV